MKLLEEKDKLRYKEFLESHERCNFQQSLEWGQVKTNWIKGVYPTEKNARAGLEAGTLYVGEMDGEIVGSYVLNHIQPEEYAKLDWEFPGEGDEIIVIHTLCIDINQDQTYLIL